MKVEYRSDIGRRRDLDEDSLVVLRSDTVYESRKLSILFLAVADGMGGHNAGEVASFMAASGVAEKMTPLLFKKNQVDTQKARLLIREAMKHVNSEVYRYVEKNPQYRDMGTTLTVALVVGHTVHIGHVGDSRAYIVNEKEIRQITKDHSLVQELVDQGELTQEEARNHPQKNVITRAVGIYQDVEVDTFTEYLYSDDYLLLCCDGLSDMLTDAEIQRVVMQHQNPQKICDTLIKEANERGGFDNISTIVATFDELPSRKEVVSHETYVRLK